MTPNDPKLSDRRSRRRLCGDMDGGEGGGSIGCDCGARRGSCEGGPKDSIRATEKGGSK